MTQHDAIRARAEQLWRELGCPCGRDEEIWLMAEEAVRAEIRSVVKAPRKTPEKKMVAKTKTAVTKKAVVNKAGTKKV